MLITRIIVRRVLRPSFLGLAWLNITKGLVLLTLDGGRVDGGDLALLPFEDSKAKSADVDSLYCMLGISGDGGITGNGDGGFAERTAVATLAYSKQLIQ